MSDETPIGELLSTEYPPLTPEEIRCIDAEASEHEALAEKAKAEARLHNAMADVAEIELRARLFSEKLELAQNFHYKTYVYSSEVDEKSVRDCMTQLTTWSRTDPGCDMEIVFNSPGGSIIAGMHLFDHICALRRAGHKVTTVAYGWAASMAGILLQSGDVREIGAESYLMIHEAKSWNVGSVSQQKDHLDFLDKASTRVVKIFASRSNGKTSEAKVRALMTRKDSYLTSDECLRYGFVDAVR